MRYDVCDFSGIWNSIEWASNASCCLYAPSRTSTVGSLFTERVRLQTCRVVQSAPSGRSLAIARSSSISVPHSFTPYFSYHFCIKAFFSINYLCHTYILRSRGCETHFENPTVTASASKYQRGDAGPPPHTICRVQPFLNTARYPRVSRRPFLNPLRYRRWILA